jgi:hypothetical protein
MSCLRYTNGEVGDSFDPSASPFAARATLDRHLSKRSGSPVTRLLNNKDAAEESTMSNLPSWLSIFGAIILLMVVTLAVTGFARRIKLPVDRGRSLADRKGLSPLRNDLLRHGLRLQATITDVQFPRTVFSRAQSKQHVVTVATAYDPDTGLTRRFTQRGDLSLGHHGDPVTVLIDPAQPSVYLIIR